MLYWWMAAGYCWFCWGSLFPSGSTLLLFAASSSCLSSTKAHSDHGGDPWGYYCTMGKAATTVAGRDAEEVIFLLCS